MMAEFVIVQFIEEYAYYFQFTLNPYDNDVETKLPQKYEIIEIFKELSDKIGSQRIIWRYDPVLINNNYTISYHVNKFNEFANILKGYTEKITFSFIDFYNRISKNIKSIGIIEITYEDKNTMAENFSHIAKENNLAIDTCAEKYSVIKYFKKNFFD
jgi:hypothetical protein